MITAAVVSSCVAPRIRPAGCSSVSSAAPLDVRHDRDAGLEPGQAERELREDEQRDRDHHQRAAVLRSVSAAVQSATTCGCSTTCHSADGDDDHVQREVDADQHDRDADRLGEPAEEHRARAAPAGPG